MIRKLPRALAPCLKAGTIMVSLLSGYYQRAFAGDCTSIGSGTYNCTDAAAPATDTSQNINIAQPLTVTTEPGFGINTSVMGGNAFNLYSAGLLLFHDANASMITGATNGIVAVNNGADSLLIRPSLKV